MCEVIHYVILKVGFDSKYVYILRQYDTVYHMSLCSLIIRLLY